MSKAPLTLLLAVSLAGCSLEPHYQRPEPPVPPGWPVGDSYLRQSEAALPSVSYRDIFRDPKLQALIAQALVDNRDLRIAAANIASARALYRVQRAALFPQITGAAGASIAGGGSRTTTSGTATGGTTTTTTSGTSSRFSADIGLNSFELDLFGRVRSLSHSALDQYFATEAAARATRLLLVGEIATAYFTLAADRSLLGVARATADNARRSVQLTGARLQGGVSSRIELRQAQTVLDQALSDVASQTTRVAQDRNALQLLVGAPIDDADLPASIESVDGLIGELPAGLGSDILLRRPDVVDAEYQLRAANARIGAARAAFFPRISLTGLLGLASSSLTGLFSGGAFNWSAGANASVPIFDAGANRGNLAYARAQRELFVARYEQTIQIAFREVSDALARRGTIDAQLTAQKDLFAAAEDYYTLSNARFRLGIDEFLTTLIAQRTLYAAQQSLALTRLQRAINLADLYRTLGGDALIEAAAAPNQAPIPLSPSPSASP
ncbi:MAG: outer membrane protein multidrug efflux system [Sphingomonadales bacterium]|jgi:multidrug efflux system outer membrane protein|nr:outer membrane protein multidrug efflux system [Sphingomonadales bacterium]